MKIIKFKKIFIFMIIGISAVMLTAGGGGSGGKSSSKNQAGSSTPCKNSTKKLYLTPIYAGTSIMMAGGRSPAYNSFQPNSNIFSGGYNNVALTIDDKTKNFCLITITSGKCTNYGTKTYVFKPDPGVSFINVEVPNDSFTVTVRLYEKCGPYYNDPSNYRANWSSLRIYDPSISNITIDGWIYNGKQFC